MSWFSAGVTSSSGWQHRPRALIKERLTLDPESLVFRETATAGALDNSHNNAQKIAFQSDPNEGLNTIIRAFAGGYNAGLTTETGPIDLADTPHRLRGFAMEGAAMSRALLDLLPLGLLTPSRPRPGHPALGRGRRLRTLAEAHGDRYIHLICVGAGWAFAQLRLRPWIGVPLRSWPATVPHGADIPILRHLAWDGWGFRQGFFRGDRVFGRHWVELPARGSARPIRDEGAGRALWFHARTDPRRIGEIIAGFPEFRRADLWSGVGLAACYTGLLPPERYDTLLSQASAFRDHLGQGAAFAAKAHLLSGEVPAGSAACVEALTGCPAEVAAEWTDRALDGIPGRGAGSGAAYQQWRAGIRAAWSGRNGAVSL